MLCVHKDTIALQIGASHTAPELVQLRQAEALRILHQHHRGIGHVHTDLHHRGGHQNVDLPPQEAQHDLFLLPGLQLSVQSLNPYLRRKNAAQPCRCLGHIFQLQGIVALDHGADHIGLSSGPQLAIDKAAGLLPIRRGNHRILDGQSVRRALREPRYPAVGIEKLCQCARNRGGGHAQHMGQAALLRQGLPLPDTEAVLLIRDHQPQALVLNALLEERMGADDQCRLSRFDGPTAFSPLCSRQRARQQHRMIRQGIGRQECLQLLIVLHRQNLRRRHQRGLAAVHGHLQHRQHGNDGFSGAYIALQETVHHLSGGHIPPDLREGRFLSLRQGKGERLHYPLQRRLPLCYEVGGLLRLLISRQHAQRKQQELVVAQALSSQPEVLCSFRKMYFLYGVRHGRKGTLFQKRRRQKILLQKTAPEICRKSAGLQQKQGLLHAFPDQGIAEALGLGIHRFEAAGFFRIFLRRIELRLGHAQLPLVAADSPVKHEAAARLQLGFEKGGIEPGQPKAAAAVPQAQADRFSAVGREQGGILLQDTFHGLHLALLQGADLPGGRKAQVGARKIPEQVRRLPEPQLLKKRLRLRSDPLQFA